jgi:hypothetical protein
MIFKSIICDGVCRLGNTILIAELLFRQLFFTANLLGRQVCGEKNRRAK